MKYSLLILASFLVVSCSEAPTQALIQNTQPAAEDQYNFWYQTVLSVPTYEYGDTLFWAGVYGEIANIGTHDIIGLRPQLFLFFTESSNNANRPDTSGFGAIGNDVYFYEEGLRWRTDTLKVDSTLTFFAAIGFPRPKVTSGIWYRMGFVKNDSYSSPQKTVSGQFDNSISQVRRAGLQGLGISSKRSKQNY